MAVFCDGKKTLLPPYFSMYLEFPPSTRGIGILNEEMGKKLLYW